MGLSDFIIWNVFGVGIFQDVGMTDGALTKFIGLVVEFQDALMQVSQSTTGSQVKLLM